MNCQTLYSEATLIEKARGGSHQAFGELVRRHSGRVYGTSFKILKNREDAEDNTQNVLCKAFNKIRQFEGKSQFSTWLVRIAINEALMMLRKNRFVDHSSAEQSALDQDACEAIQDSHADPESQYITKELATKAIGALNPVLRDTFILQKGEGWTNREVAIAMGITTETVKSRVFRARVRLRQRLQSLACSESLPLAS
jgi:RNA polymerase sigma-70 factor (ECF subfamily)